MQNLERIFPQLMKTLEPRDIMPILRARGFLTSSEWTQINGMVREACFWSCFDAFTLLEEFLAPLTDFFLNNPLLPDVPSEARAEADRDHHTQALLVGSAQPCAQQRRLWASGFSRGKEHTNDFETFVSFLAG